MIGASGWYSRIAAIYTQSFKDIGPPLIQLIWNEFYGLLKSKNPNKLETKLKNARYMSELIKFKVCPPMQIFNMLKKCYEDFHFHNIDIVCAIMENCGRFLLYHPTTNPKMEHSLQVMMRLKKQVNNSYSTMIENAYYICKHKS